MKEFFKKFGLAVLAAVVLLLILYAPYLSKQLKFATGQVAQTPPPEIPKGTPNQLQIPSLDITAPIVHITGTDENAFQAGLINGVVLYPGTAEVGTVGNSYIFGHSSDFAFSKGHYKTVFALLPKIELGAEIIVTDGQGNQFKYKVTDKKVVEKTDLSVLSQDTAGKKILSLQTSWPVGTALKRYLVRAELEQ